MLKSRKSLVVLSIVIVVAFIIIYFFSNVTRGSEAAALAELQRHGSGGYTTVIFTDGNLDSMDPYRKRLEQHVYEINNSLLHEQGLTHFTNRDIRDKHNAFDYKKYFS